MSPTVAWILLSISLLADVISLVESVRAAKSGSVKRQIIWALAIAVLSAIITYQGITIQRYNTTKNEARSLVASWPSIDHIDFISKGERIGIVLAGMRFLEHHKSEYPETYAAAKSLVHNRLGDFRAPEGVDASLAEYDRLKDGAAAMIQLVRSVSQE